MKKILVAIVLFLGVGIGAQAQKFAYVDTQYILDNIPEYKMSQTQLDDLSKKWQQEIEEKIGEIDRLFKAYQTDAVLLPEDVKKQREDEIFQKEKNLRELKKKRFGKDGDLFKKREELIKPLQDKIFNAIKTMADQRGYAMIFDRSGSLSILYANERYDKSDEVLEDLGYSAGGSNSGKSGGSGSSSSKNSTKRR
ncbi:MAG: OmpH family outer membrane protein [Bacteroidetes bacterium]|nr:MAG: OmpH family outer membrane protein [Bacteroidota bacterium]